MKGLNEVHVVPLSSANYDNAFKNPLKFLEKICISHKRDVSSQKASDLLQNPSQIVLVLHVFFHCGFVGPLFISGDLVKKIV